MGVDNRNHQFAPGLPAGRLPVQRRLSSVLGGVEDDVFRLGEDVLLRRQELQHTFPAPATNVAHVRQSNVAHVTQSWHMYDSHQTRTWHM